MSADNRKALRCTPCRGRGCLDCHGLGYVPRLTPAEVRLCESLPDRVWMGVLGSIRGVRGKR